jgi:ribosomal protein L37E
VLTERARDTGQECRDCHDGTYYKDGYELVCGACGYVPTRSENSGVEPWAEHRADVQRRADEIGVRPRLVGGYADAYFGDGSYAFGEEGFSI